MATIDDMTEQATDILDTLTAFRLATFEVFPYLSDMVYALQPVERPGMGTMAVDKWARLYYDPEFVAKLTKEQGAWVILHETSHLTLRHHARAELIFGSQPKSSRATEDFNIAADLVIYELLESYNQHMPDFLGQLVTMQWAQSKWPDIKPNMTVEQIYSIIAASRGEEGDDEQGDDEQDDEQDGDEQGGGGSGRPGESDGEQEVRPIDGGSAADGVPRDYELEPDPNWEGYVENELLRRVEKKLEQENPQPGTAAGTFADSIRQHLRPAPDPWKLLRNLVGRTTANANVFPLHTYSRRNRRQGAYPNMPLLKGIKHESPSACCIIDTSGSMCGEALRKALNAVNQGVRTIGKLRVIWGDVQVCGDTEFAAFTPEFRFTGRGGTDMRPLIEHAIKEHDPDLICVVTDGWTPWPSAKPKKAKMVVALTEEGCVRSLPKWNAGCVVIPNE